MKSNKKGSRGSATKTIKKGGNRLHVAPSSGGWTVRKEGSTSASGVYRTKDAAERAAKELLRRGVSGEIRIHGRDGRIQEYFTVGRKDFAKISAIEGLNFSAELKRDFDELDRRGKSDAQRRKTITRKYAKHRV